jgi:hypothetical protein
MMGPAARSVPCVIFHNTLEKDCKPVFSITNRKESAITHPADSPLTCLTQLKQRLKSLIVNPNQDNDRVKSMVLFFNIAVRLAGLARLRRENINFKHIPYAIKGR